MIRLVMSNLILSISNPALDSQYLAVLPLKTARPTPVAALQSVTLNWLPSPPTQPHPFTFLLLSHSFDYLNSNHLSSLLEPIINYF